MENKIPEFHSLDDRVTEEEWRRLIDLLIKFRDQKYWNYMSDNLVFGIELPFADKRVYCTILGYHGMTYGITAYKGEAGLLVIENMKKGLKESNIGFHYEAVAGLLMDRDDLAEVDYKLLQDLDLRFRGKNNWPSFRTHTRGYYPRHLKKDEVKMMTIVLEQAMVVAKKVKDNIKDYFQREEYYLRVPEKQAGDGDIIWQDKFTKIDPYSQSEVFKGVKLRGHLLNDLKEQCEKKEITLALDRFNFPDPVQDGQERPYYPDLFLLVDLENEFILDHLMQRPEENLDAIMASLINYMKKNLTIPSRVVTRKEEITEFIFQVCRQLDIKLEFDPANTVLENIEEEMFNFRGVF